MEEYELWLLLAFAALVAAKVLQQAARLCAPVRVPPLHPPPGADAVQAARDAAQWALYAKAGRPPGRKRLGITLSLLAAVAACTPVWWRLTEVHRAPLPLPALAAAGEAPPLAPTLRLHVVSVGAAPVADASAAARALAERVAAALAAAGVGGFAVSVTLTAPSACAEAEAEPPPGAAPPPLPKWRCYVAGASRAFGPLSDAEVDEKLQGLGGREAWPGAYSLLLLPGARCGGAVFGAHRHAFSRCDAPDVEQLAVAAARRFGAAATAAPPPPLGADGALRLEFALCNAAPAASHRFSWDFAAAEQRFLAPMAAALAPLAQLRVGSAVLLHTALGGGAAPRWDAAQRAHVLPAAALPQLVDPEWPLHAPGGAPAERVLHMVALVPPRRHCPLRLPGGAPGFTSPGWGAVTVWNPPECGANETAPADSSGVRELSEGEMRSLMAHFAAQLRVLLGLPASPGPDDVPAAAAAFAEWEVDALARRAAAAHASAAAESLAALGRVVRALPSMPVSDVISRLAARALDAGAAAARLSAAGAHADAAAAAAAAHSAAEGAFFHPSVLALLYFPSDHKLAVYLPLFLPVLLPLTLAAMREGRHYRYRRAFARAYREQEAQRKAE